MAGLQDDLASVFEEIGTLVEIVGSSPVVREYIDVEQTYRCPILSFVSILLKAR